MGTNPPALEDSVVSGRGGDKERLRKTTMVSQKGRIEGDTETVRQGKTNKLKRLVV